MSSDARELAQDCWQAINMLNHPSAGQPEIPEWLAAAASHLPAHELPKPEVKDDTTREA